MPDPRAELVRYGSCTLDDDGCSTCGDIAVPVRVLAIGGDGEAVVEDRSGRQAAVAVDLVPGAGPGDVLMVHLGVAIARVSPPG